MPNATKVTPLTRNPVARRIARWINAQHDGNVRAAARAIGLDHVTLWRAATGRFTHTPIAAIDALAKTTNTSLDWWMHGRGDRP
jgi:hypothetical protein